MCGRAIPMNLIQDIDADDGDVAAAATQHSTASPGSTTCLISPQGKQKRNTDAPTSGHLLGASLMVSHTWTHPADSSAPHEITKLLLAPCSPPGTDHATANPASAVTAAARSDHE